MRTRRHVGSSPLAVVVMVAGLCSWAIAQENTAPPAAPEAPATPAAPAATQPAAGDITGNWVWVVEGPGGETEVLLKLKQEDQKLTGSLSGFGGEEWEIQSGTITPDGQFSFKVVRDFGGQTMTSTYTGKAVNGTLSGKMETVFTRGFEAKRQTEQPQEQPADQQPQEEQAPAQEEQQPAQEEQAPPAQEEPAPAQEEPTPAPQE